MKLILAFALLCVAGAAFAECEITMSSTTTFKGKPFAASVITYSALDAGEVATVEKGFAKALDVGNAVKGKGGHYDITLKASKTCDGGAAQPYPTTVLSGIKAADAVKWFKAGTKATITDVVDMANQGGRKG